MVKDGAADKTTKQLFHWLVLIFHKRVISLRKNVLVPICFTWAELEEKWLKNSKKTTTYCILYCKMLHYSIKILILLHTMKQQSIWQCTPFHIMIYNWLILLFSKSQNSSGYLWFDVWIWKYIQGIGMCVQYIIDLTGKATTW